MYHISGVTCQVSGVICNYYNFFLVKVVEGLLSTGPTPLIQNPGFQRCKIFQKPQKQKNVFQKNAPNFRIILAPRRPKDGQNRVEFNLQSTGQHYRVKCLIFVAYFPLKTIS